MKLTHDQMQELVDHLQGTCMSLDGALDECFEIDLNEVENQDEMCDYLDNRLFECAECGWWCEAGDWWIDNPNPENGDICSSCGEYR